MQETRSILPSPCSSFSHTVLNRDEREQKKTVTSKQINPYSTASLEKCTYNEDFHTNRNFTINRLQHFSYVFWNRPRTRTNSPSDPRQRIWHSTHTERYESTIPLNSSSVVLLSYHEMETLIDPFIPMILSVTWEDPWKDNLVNIIVVNLSTKETIILLTYIQSLCRLWKICVVIIQFMISALNEILEGSTIILFFSGQNIPIEWKHRSNWSYSTPNRVMLTGGPGIIALFVFSK